MSDIDLDEIEDQILKEAIERVISQQKDIEPEIQEAASRVIWDML